MTWHRVLQLLGFGVGVAAVVVILLVAWISQSLPDLNNLSNSYIAESTVIYARDGKTVLYDIHGDQKRTVVTLADINPLAIKATIAMEDKNFYTNPGISIRGIIRSVFVDILTGKKAQGGSTMTQQLVRSVILTREKAFTRKIKELALSYQLTHRYTKDQILTMYFNDIPYGGSAYGIQAASEMYFGKSAKDIDLAECAMLASVIKGPTYYSPDGNHRTELVARTKLVLDRMVADGYITAEEATAAKAVDILARVQPIRNPIVAPHFVFYIRDQLVQKYGELEVEQGGLRVVTTIDPRLQKIAEEEVAAGAKKNDKKGADNAALVATDPHTGQILAMVGSRDFFDKKHDGEYNVATAVRNPGSSFKPIVYLTAFERGFSPDTLLFDLKTDFGPDGSGKNFSPNNYDFKEHGPLTMRQTLAGSLNIPAVKTLYLAGINNTLDQAEKLGYSTIDRQKVGLALAIGGGGVTLLDHVSAFATLANNGARNASTGILRIEDSSGKVLEEYKKNETQVADKNAVLLLQSVMTDNNARSFVFGSRSPLILPDRPVAAKTGTTNDWKDGWTMGFTPSLAAGVWVGNNDNTAMARGMDGVVVAAPIWHNFMARATAKTKVERFTKPSPAKETKPVLQGKLANELVVSVDSVTGKKIPDSCLSAWPAAFVKQATIKQVHTILYYLDKNDPNGPTPTNPAADPMFARWDKPIQQWAKKNGYLDSVPAEESCSLRVSATGVSITLSAPTNGQTITATTLPASIAVQGFGDGLQVVYALDGTTVATATSEPFSADLDLATTPNGFHTLTATANDTAGHTATASVSINTLTQKATTLYFIQPAAHATISTGSFPVAVRVYAYDPGGLSSLTLYNDSADGGQQVIDTISNPSSTTPTLSWATTVPGTYRLYLVAKTKAGKTAESDRLPVTVH